MNFKAKIIIVIVAIILSFLFFNLMTSTSSVELITIGKKAGHEIIANYLAHTPTPNVPHLI